MLDRVRALLAQAESTTFEAEAETFTAKAQQLMTRHAIDMAMVSAGSRRAERPDTIRIAIDDPYLAAKSLLLQLVAASSRCRAVFHQRFAMSSVVGFAADLDRHGDAVHVAAGAGADRDARSRRSRRHREPGRGAEGSAPRS